MKNIFCIIIVILISLKGYGQDSLRKNYFNISEFKVGKTYNFVDVNKKGDLHQWRMYYKLEASDTVFYTDGLDEQNRIIEVFVEKLQIDGSKMIAYHTVDFDSTGNGEKIISSIMMNNVYKYNQEEYPIEWSTLSSEVYGRVKLTKRRSIVSTSETQIIFKASYDCLVFKDEFKVEYLDANQVYKFHQLSYYAVGFGLVRYKRTMPNGLERDYRLKEIIQ
jgi:hypothetical protein